MNAPEHCRAISHVDVELKTKVSELTSILKMDTDEISETLVFISNIDKADRQRRF
jgi:hypothetical protein